MPRRHLTADDSAIVLIDHAVGFANLIGSTDVGRHVSNAVALAKVAKAYDVPLVVTNGPDTAPSGPLYPQLLEVLDDHPIVVRTGAFDGFDEQPFADAIEATGRKRLLFAGLMTEGCVLHTALTAHADGYETFLVVDASAGETCETHDVAVQRAIQAGIVPTTWLSLASEFQRSWDRLETAGALRQIIFEHSTPFAMHGAIIAGLLAGAGAAS